jgi:hypothetical protein
MSPCIAKVINFREVWEFAIKSSNTKRTAAAEWLELTIDMVDTAVVVAAK